MKIKAIISSILWALLILLFYIMAGVITQVMKMNDIQTRLIQGGFVWLSVLTAFLYFWISKKSLKSYGFRKVQKSNRSIVLWYIPIIILELSGLSCGLVKLSFTYIMVNLFLTIAVGFAEEIYFRSIILNTLKKLGLKKAIIISSIIFGVSHSANIAGGKDVTLTIIQIVFAFVIGIVFSELFVLTESIYPVIIWHFIHDFLCYITVQPKLSTILVFSGFQTLILITYAIVLWRKLPQYD